MVGTGSSSRVESNAVGGQILISKATFDRIDFYLRVDGRLEVHPKGFEEPVALFDIGGMTARTGEQIYLPTPGESLVRLPEPLPVRIALMEGSRTGTTLWDGELLSLSHRAAMVRSPVEIEPLTNLRLDFLQRSGASSTPSLLAKVLSVEAKTGTFVARFTSVEPATAALLERLLA